MILSNHLQQQLLSLAGRAPTPHNTQPWELLISNAGLSMIEDPSRWLPACDPEKRDHQVGLGAFIEGVHLILSEEGLGISQIINESTGERMKYRLEITTGFTADPLRLEIAKRQCFRGQFETATASDIETLKTLTKGEAIILSGEQKLNALAKESDLAATRSNRNPAIQSELSHWLRLTEKHPLYHIDGLNREALALPKAVGFIAQLLMKPPVYRFLDRLGMSAFLNSEAAQIRSATGLVCLQRLSNEETPLERGRRLYRLWLRLTASGFYACPQSSLTDDAQASAFLESLTDSDRTYICLRVGRIGTQNIPPVARRKLVHLSGETHEK
ncbi:MAG: hypothetical protein KF789_10665 [Bdellovibrionaceae bacterium]|nr:hypothetical protein [Pseudobdellovibrionaceae bacterium]